MPHDLSVTPPRLQNQGLMSGIKVSRVFSALTTLAAYPSSGDSKGSLTPPTLCVEFFQCVTDSWEILLS